MALCETRRPPDAMIDSHMVDYRQVARYLDYRPPALSTACTSVHDIVVTKRVTNVSEIYDLIKVM